MVPVIMAMIALLYFGGRATLAWNSLQGIADDAARTATLQRTEKSAQKAAEKQVQYGLENAGLACIGGAQVTVSAAEIEERGYELTGDVPASAYMDLYESGDKTVDVRIDCVLDMMDLRGGQKAKTALTYTVTVTGHSATDIWRER
jgi:hypothetical protein